MCTIALLPHLQWKLIRPEVMNQYTTKMAFKSPTKYTVACLPLSSVALKADDKSLQC